MNNKIFIDSSIFVENFKGNSVAKEILEISIDKFEIYINSIVFSEVIFKLMAIKSGKSALTIRSQKIVSSIMKELKIKTSLTSEQVEKLLKEFEERKKAEVALDKLRGILKTDKSAEELIEEIYEKIMV